MAKETFDYALGFFFIVYGAVGIYYNRKWATSLREWQQINPFRPRCWGVVGPLWMYRGMSYVMAAFFVVLGGGLLSHRIW